MASELAHSPFCLPARRVRPLPSPRERLSAAHEGRVDEGGYRLQEEGLLVPSYSFVRSAICSAAQPLTGRCLLRARRAGWQADPPLAI